MTADPAPIQIPSPLSQDALLLQDAFPLLAFPLRVDGFYASLIRHASSVETGMGGRLLYLGELDENGRALMVASNIAGAASLAVTADPVAQKQSIHEGVADFLVNSLDEALRILKNEIRKGEPVAVCIAAPRATIEQEMLERGVLPDFVRDPGGAGRADNALDFGAGIKSVPSLALPKDQSIVTWSVEEGPAQWLPRLDAIATECIASDESTPAQISRRWLRLAPRYLGRLARNVRLLRCSTAAANSIAERMNVASASGEIAVRVRIEVV
jgi:hypothetical protein